MPWIHITELFWQVQDEIHSKYFSFKKVTWKKQIYSLPCSYTFQAHQKLPFYLTSNCVGCQSLYSSLDSILACQLMWRVIWNSIKEFQTFQELYNGKIHLWKKYRFSKFVVRKTRSFYNLNLCSHFNMTYGRHLTYSGYLQAVRMPKENSCLACETGEWDSRRPGPAKRLYLI